MIWVCEDASTTNSRGGRVKEWAVEWGKKSQFCCATPPRPSHPPNLPCVICVVGGLMKRETGEKSAQILHFIRVNMCTTLQMNFFMCFKKQQLKSCTNRIAN